MAGVLDAVAAALADPDLRTLLMIATPGAVVDADALAWLRPRARNQSEVGLGPAGHFTPEERPDAIAAAVTAWA